MAESSPAIRGRKITDLKVAELKQELEKRDQDTSGLKSELVERLVKILNTDTDRSSEQSETSSETIPEANIGARGQDKWKNSAAQADSPFSEFVTLNHFEKIQTDFVEFKRFTHGEILSLKADVANRSPGRKAYTHDTNKKRKREAWFRCLQERIKS